ncbi:MAG TPA: carboxy terminal-processing peptidase [Methylotenera sp.]|nr:carboxy terminal-processing peptidase [Methylotenera sp.]
MKNKLLLLLAFLTALQSGLVNSATQVPQINPLTQQSEAAHLSAEVLSRYHYKPIKLDDNSSAKIFDNYIKSLDSQRIFFTQPDIDRISEARTKLDDSILKEDLTIPFAIFNLYQARVIERNTYARSLLTKGFDFTKDENYEITREKSNWAQSNEELNDIWRKRVKNDWLRLKLAGKDDKSIVTILDKRYENFLKGVNKIKNDDVFQSFMNAYTLSIDPHTNYFGIRASDDFNISMKLSLDGIGAVLQDKDEYTTIRELVPGGPAALSGKLNIGDRILGVGQGNNAIVDVTGWRLDDTVDLIRGPENSIVTLDILPAEAGPDGKHTIVTLTRKKISLEQQNAKKSVIEVKDGDAVRKIGVIDLPVFYQDFGARQKGEKEFKSAARDVKRLLEELKKDKVDAILIDLRNNGGGSLDEAVELTGLFIDKGPVLQERDVKGSVKVDSDTKSGAAWDGPLGILINRASASASEIFAAAIQDYGRGVIIGEQSFGKGTVQSVVNLDNLVRNDKPKFGELKMTVAQFFRVNGGTTQLKGVTPDVSLPSMTNVEDFGESSFDNALPWTQIKAADFTPSGNLKELVPVLVTKHDARIGKDKDFKYLLEDIAEAKALTSKNMISLNESKRRKEREAQDLRLASRDTDGKKSTNKNTQQDDGLNSSERNLSKDIELEKSRKNNKDIYLNEAANILSDEVSVLKANGKANVQVKN